MVNENVSPLVHKIANGTPCIMRQIVIKNDAGVFDDSGILHLNRPPKFMRVDTQHVRDFVVGHKRQKRSKQQGSFQVEPGYCFTFHKVQGITAESGVLMDLNLSPPEVGKVLAQLDLSGIYVAMSRARALAKMRIFPFNERGYSHLLRLAKRKHFPALAEALHLTPLTYATSPQVIRSRPAPAPRNRYNK